MKLYIKDFAVDMEIKNKGIEIEVRDPAGDHLGDFYVTKTAVIWCKGKIPKDNGKKLTWAKFIKYMDSLP